ncbi:MAG: putative Ig domain-containing protein, partial [Longimicrobiales bacterium]|nr:putative Ig domain-containing protein [Longimicrobiales bacterium]
MYTDTDLASDQPYTYRLRACNDGGCSEYSGLAEARTFGVLAIVTDSLPRGQVGQTYTADLDAANAGSRYTWTLVSGALPDGLSLLSSGVVSGTPTDTAVAQVTFRVTSIDGQTAEATYPLEIQAPQSLVIDTYVLPPVIVGGPYDVALAASGGGTERVWSLASGTLPAGLSLDATGAIAGTPTAVESAAITLRVESFGLTDERDFVLEVVPNDETAYNITPLAVSSAPDSIQPAVDSAIARWERVITANAQAVRILPGTFSSSSCGGFGDAVNGTTLDDIIVLINIGPIDGAGEGGFNTIGLAGPCAIRSEGSTDPNLPAFGLLTLDSYDLGTLVGTDLLTDLIFHEIGHVLGFGSLWEFLDLVSGSGTNDPTFTGSGALEEWSALGGTGNVPLANTGDTTTVEGHWRESVFDAEIMTGFAEQVGVEQPLSRVTIASMEDMGYTADRSQADDFSLTSALVGFTTDQADDGALLLDRLLRVPIYVLDPDGTVQPEPAWPR